MVFIYRRYDCEGTVVVSMGSWDSVFEEYFAGFSGGE